MRDASLPSSLEYVMKNKAVLCVLGVDVWVHQFKESGGFFPPFWWPARCTYRPKQTMASIMQEEDDEEEEEEDIMVTFSFFLHARRTYADHPDR